MVGPERHEGIIPCKSGRTRGVIMYFARTRLCMVGNFCNEEKESDHCKYQVQLLDKNTKVWDHGPM